MRPSRRFHVGARAAAAGGNRLRGDNARTVKLRVALLAVLGVGLAACAEAAAPEPQFARANAEEQQGKPYVLLISLDGFRHDYLDIHDAPNLERWASDAVRAESLVPGYPSDTFPNHYAIATGMHPGTHGIVSNDFVDRTRDARFRLGDRDAVEDGGWYGGTPLWVAAERAGMVAASYFWVGTEADIQGVRPSYYHTYDGSVTQAERVRTVLEWFSWPEAYRPHLVTLYFSAIDSAAHDYGTRSVDLASAIARLDARLGDLFDGLDALDFGVNVFIVSDHGMIDVDPERVIHLDDIVDLQGVRVIGSGSHSLLYVDGETRVETLYRALKNAESGYRVFRSGETPEAWMATHPRFGDLIVAADAPYSIRFRNMRGAVSGGAHGYDPGRHPEMHGIFFAKGPELVDATTIPSFENIHIYPLVMRILGLEIAQDIDGRLDVLQGILR